MVGVGRAVVWRARGGCVVGPGGCVVGLKGGGAVVWWALAAFGGPGQLCLGPGRAFVCIKVVTRRYINLQHQRLY